jgi:hypothetical protein
LEVGEIECGCGCGYVEYPFLPSFLPFLVVVVVKEVRMGEN